mgnify:FL=1
MVDITSNTQNMDQVRGTMMDAIITDNSGHVTTKNLFHMQIML